MTKQQTNFQFTSSGNHDECYTPDYVVEAIVPFIPKDKIIWCPFDKEWSPFVRVLKSQDYTVTYSHQDFGQNFYNYEPAHWDIMVSNPPFTGKRQIFERALSFNKPFGLLMTVSWLQDAAPKQLFAEKDLQLFMFKDRVKYLDGDGNIIGDKVNFASAFFCWSLLPKQIMMTS